MTCLIVSVTARAGRDVQTKCGRTVTAVSWKRSLADEGLTGFASRVTCGACNGR